jgi:hypothetical protein
VQTLLLAIIAISLVWMAFGGSDDADDVAAAAYPVGYVELDEDAIERLGHAERLGYAEDLGYAEPLGYAEDLGYAEPLGYAEDLGYAAGDAGAYVEDQGGYGYGEEGAFRGEAEVGGVPIVSGTVDDSGEGNHVFSVGGEVLDLP